MSGHDFPHPRPPPSVLKAPAMNDPGFFLFRAQRTYRDTHHSAGLPPNPMFW
jgi:hypothetical protein